jgi:hypothetical protein
MLFLHFRLKKFIFFIYLFLFTALSYAYPTPISLSDDFAEKSIGEYFAYFVDKNELHLGIEEISKQRFDSLSYKRHILNFDFINFNHSQKVIWLKFQVKAQRLSPDKHFFLEIKSPLLDQIEFYHFLDDANKWKGQVTGGHYPLRKRLFEHRTYIFDLHVKPSHLNTYYLKVTTADMMTVYPILYERNAFVRQALNEQMGFGTLYGLLFAIFIINLMFGFWYKKNIYTLFVAIILVGILIIVRINGHSYVYLWAGMPWWENRALPMLILGFVILLSLFSFKLLSNIIKEQILYYSILFNILLSVVLLVITLYDPTSWVISTATLIGLFNVLAVFLTSIYEILRGEPEKDYFVTASYLLFIGVLLTFFRFFDIIETGSFLGTYGFEIGFIVFIALTTISLRIRKKNREI